VKKRRSLAYFPAIGAKNGQRWAFKMVKEMRATALEKQSGNGLDKELRCTLKEASARSIYPDTQVKFISGMWGLWLDC
jgi:hypothetical protein